MTDIPTIAKGLSEAQDIPDELVQRICSEICMELAHSRPIAPVVRAALREVRAYLMENGG